MKNANEVSMFNSAQAELYPDQPAVATKGRDLAC